MRKRLGAFKKDVPTRNKTKKNRRRRLLKHSFSLKKMKSPRYNISFPAEVQEDLANHAAQLGISVSEFVRESTVKCLSRITKKKYDTISWGGVREFAGRPAEIPAIRTAAESVRAAARKSVRATNRRAAQ